MSCRRSLQCRLRSARTTLNDGPPVTTLQVWSSGKRLDYDNAPVVDARATARSLWFGQSVPESVPSKGRLLVEADVSMRQMK